MWMAELPEKGLGAEENRLCGWGRRAQRHLEPGTREKLKTMIYEAPVSPPHCGRLLWSECCPGVLRAGVTETRSGRQCHCVPLEMMSPGCKFAMTGSNG